MKVAIIGLGLMGGSLGRALIKKTDCSVYACDKNEDSLKKGELLGCYGERLTKENAGEVDLAVVTVYPSAFFACADEWCKYLKAGATVVDCGGNKRVAVRDMERLAEIYPDINFIATHPMAGREFSGVEHSTASLYENCSWLICAVRASLESISALKRTLKAVGARKIIHTSPEEHDRIIAYTSQLCHVVSSCMVKSPTAEKGLGFTAGSFRDLTRVARLSPEMWAELFLQNADNLIGEIESMERRLKEYRIALETGDEAKLKALLQDGTDRKISIDRSFQRFFKDEDKG